MPPAMENHQTASLQPRDGQPVLRRILLQPLPVQLPSLASRNVANYFAKDCSRTISRGRQPDKVNNRHRCHVVTTVMEQIGRAHV